MGKRLFPRSEADMMAEETVSHLNQFAQDIGLLDAPVPYAQVVATRFCHLWTA